MPHPIETHAPRSAKRLRPRPFRLLWILLALILAPADAPAADIQGALEQLLTSIQVGDTKYSVAVYDLTRQIPLAEIHADQPLIPASNQKLITTASALLTLGPDFDFQTQLIRRGSTLILRGDGDPALGDPRILAQLELDYEQLIQSWIQQIKKSGLTHVTELIIDDRAFDRTFVHPNWPAEQLHKWSFAPVAALNFNDNCVELFTCPTTVGQPPKIHFTPLLSPIQITNHARTVTNKKDGPGASRKIGTNQITVRGPVKLRRIKPIEVTIHDPPVFLGNLLANHLKNAGITVDRVRRVKDDEPIHDGAVIAAVRTPLPVILDRTNTDSQNMFAEALIKRMGLHATGQPGSWSNGTAAIRLALSHMLGPDAAAIIVDDGSGLSRENRVSARLLVRILAYMHQSPQLGQIYIDSLARPRKTGTLAKRFSTVNLVSDVRAKSGSINRVIALSGYIMPDEQRTIAFSILINDYSSKKSGIKGGMKRFTEQLVGTIDAQLTKESQAAAVEVGG